MLFALGARRIGKSLSYEPVSMNWFFTLALRSSFAMAKRPFIGRAEVVEEPKTCREISSCDHFPGISRYQNPQFVALMVHLAVPLFVNYLPLSLSYIETFRIASEFRRKLYFRCGWGPIFSKAASHGAKTP